MIALLEDGLEAGALGHVVGPVHLARLLRAAGRDDRALQRAEALQRRLLHPPARRIEQGARSASRKRSTIAEACGIHVEIVHFKCSGMDNWGKAAQRARHDRRRQGARPRRRLRLPIPTPPAPIR